MDRADGNDVFRSMNHLTTGISSKIIIHTLKMNMSEKVRSEVDNVVTKVIS